MQYKSIGYKQRGSSLIGVAIMTLVVGALAVGAIHLMNTYGVIKSDQENVDNSITLQEGIDNFVAIHKRYPCPARMNIAPDQPGFGLEDCSIPNRAGRANLPVKIGSAPVRTLNVPDKMIIDGYGKRFIYAVTQSMTTNSADVVNGLGAIFIRDENGNSISQGDGYVVYALISPGEDNRGARDINGTVIASCPTSGLARENCDGDARFISTTQKNFRGANNDFTSSFAFKGSALEHHWVLGNWSSCVGECDTGTQTRSVTCRDKQNNNVNDNKCSHTIKPETVQSCSIGRCYWERTPWSTCEGICFSGNQDRSVQCKNHLGNDTADQNCENAGLAEPTTERTCNLGPCRWRTESWGTCRGVCFSGEQTRSISCLDHEGNVTLRRHCNRNDVQRPSTERSCTLGACSWQPTEWSTCS